VTIPALARWELVSRHDRAGRAAAAIKAAGVLAIRPVEAEVRGESRQAHVPHVEVRQLTVVLKQSSQHWALLIPGGQGPQVWLQEFQVEQKTWQLASTHAPF